MRGRDLGISIRYSRDMEFEAQVRGGACRRTRYAAHGLAAGAGGSGDAMSGEAAGRRQARRGPAPFASFDHDVSDESSPESKLTFQLPEIREDTGASGGTRGPSPALGGGGCVGSPSGGLAPPEQRARSHSTPAVHSSGALATPAAPRIDISRASSSSHHDSRDSSPEMALFAGTAGDDNASSTERARLELAFREDGALDLRSSTEELAFLEPDTAETEKESPRAPAAVCRSPGPISTASSSTVERRHSRKDSQSSEAALLAISGRQSRLSSIGSQGSAHSAVSNVSHLSDYSHVSKLSVISGVSRSPSPHKMLFETSFCGPKPIENEPEICTAVSERRLLEITNLSDKILGRASDTRRRSSPHVPSKRELRTEATIETAPRQEPSGSGLSTSMRVPSAGQTPVLTSTITPSIPISADVKQQKELNNQKKVEEKKASTGAVNRVKVKRTSRSRNDTPEVYSSKNKSKDIIRIKLKPDDEYDDDDEESERTLVGREPPQKPDSLDLGDCTKKPSHFNELVSGTEPVLGSLGDVDKKLQSKIKVSPEYTPRASPTLSRKGGRKDTDSRTPSPAGAVSVSRKSSFCSLFKSRETIASPDSPSTIHLRRKKSINEGTRSRSKSRDRSTTPNSGNKIKGSVLSLFKTPKKGSASLSPGSHESSPGIQSVPQRQFVHQHVEIPKNTEKLKYYEDSKDGIIHIPLHTPPDERPSTSGAGQSRQETTIAQVTAYCESVRPASAPTTIPSASLPTAIAQESACSASSQTTSLKQVPPKKLSTTPKPIQRTVLPDGSIIIPLHSPTEKVSELKDRCPSQQIEEQKIMQDVKVELNTKQVVQEPLDNICPSEPISERREPEKQKKERLTFITSVGSKEQLFSTQLSITKTPSVTSEISESFPSFPEGAVDVKCEVNGGQNILRDTHITTLETPGADRAAPPTTTSSAPVSVVRCGSGGMFISPSTSSITATEAVPIKAHPMSSVAQFNTEFDLSPGQRPFIEGGSNNSVIESKSNDDIHDSSESDISSEIGSFKKNTLRDLIVENISAEEVEKKSLVVTQESFEEELPYVPTTLPLERSVALPMVPVRERPPVTAMRVRPVDRPRSTTPIHPSAFEEYLSDEPRTPDNAKPEKIKISLPRTSDRASASRARSKSPRRGSQSTQPWEKFAERGLPHTPARRASTTATSSAGIATSTLSTTLPSKPHWINFEEVPERRKQPKRIQTIPREKTPEMRRSENRSGAGDASATEVVYCYVAPEECRCECHGARRDDTTPLLPAESRRLHPSTSFHSDSSAEFCDGVESSELQLSVAIGRPFTMDLQLRGDRSSLEQEATSPAEGAGRH
ncbi:hypothetical protein EVAR_22591_1 [Eumeta japonica]|uniref:Uncharacterized protein n=1 Tax=Eumeta variegata TaxID=151549 RepID=A0A4C1U7G1_EUMVA|nr:hypothetical protein EVAR_22591_1 [Eumeta japonica]